MLQNKVRRKIFTINEIASDIITRVLRVGFFMADAI
jgi:hypothetical protein